MPIDVQAPDGSIARFPDDTPDDVIEKAMRDAYGGPSAAAEPRITKRGMVVPLAEYDNGTVGLAMPGFIAGPIEAAKRIMETPVTHPDEMTNRQAAELLGSGLEAASLGVTGSVPALTREAASNIAMTKAFGPRTDLAPLPNPRVPAPTPQDEIVSAANRLGIDVPVAAATDNYSLRALAGGTKEIPVVGTPIVKAAQRASEGLGKSVQSLVDELGNATPQEAGHAVRSEAADWIKRGSQQEGRDIYQDVDALMVGSGGPLTRTKAAVQDIVDTASESRLPPPGIVKTLSDAVSDPNGLSYEGASNLRTQIGDMLSGKIAPEPGMNSRALKQIYGALSDDLRDMAGEAGANLVSKRNAKKGMAQGIALWDAANARFQTEIAQKREDLTRIIGSQGDVAPEAIVSTLTRMAGSKGGADLGRLQQAISVMTPDTRRDLAAAVIDHMGRDKDGFSPARFRTDYARLSPGGKQLLFPDPAHRQALDDIASVARAYEQLQRLGNPSGTGRVTSIIGAAASALASPWLTLAGVIGGYGVARMLARPATARALADASKAHLQAVASGNPKAIAAYQAALRSALEMGQQEATEAGNE